MIGLSVITAYLHCNLGDVSSFARKNFIFCGISTVVFLVNNSGGVFLLRVSGSARFFLLSKLCVSLEISLKLVEIDKFYGLGLIFVRREKLLVYDL